jgi:hypothetical protein
MLSRKLLALSIASALVSAPAIAADNPASHQHGHAEMQLAFSDNQVEILLMSPAGNMLGFEHHPRTPEQHQTANNITNWLKETPLVNTQESTCTLQEGTVQHELADDRDHDAHSHDDQNQHADITVTQVLNCPGLDTSASLTTPLTTRFPGLEHLDIAWAGPDGQGAIRLNHEDNSFRLGR